MGGLGSADRLLSTLLALGALACCARAAEWKPFRTTDGTCHEVVFSLQRKSTPTTSEGQEACQLTLGKNDWQLSKIERWSERHPGYQDSGSPVWAYTCRRCGLPKDSLLMWFGRAPSCFGSCPPGWQTLTYSILSTWNGAVDPSPSDPYTSSPNFGGQCSGSSIGKVLCALGGRPDSAKCTYTWRGKAPNCLDACEAGETLIAKDAYGDGDRCASGTGNKMLCERCESELYNLNDCTWPTWFGTAPVCQGECNTGDRVMARAATKDEVPADQDPDGFGSNCWNYGWKVRCQQCKLRNLLGSGGGTLINRNATCTKPKVGVVWKGTPYLALANVKTYDRCCRECHDAPACRRFHVGPTGCFMFPTPSGALAAVTKRVGRAGGGVWQAGSKQG